jgi:hypothetical protein
MEWMKQIGQSFLVTFEGTLANREGGTLLIIFTNWFTEILNGVGTGL